MYVWNIQGVMWHGAYVGCAEEWRFSGDRHARKHSHNVEVVFL